jgi:hypothetical protein
VRIARPASASMSTATRSTEHRTLVGFQNLEKRTQIPAKSLMRMLGPKGSPSVVNLTSILTALQKTEGVHFELLLR